MNGEEKQDYIVRLPPEILARLRQRAAKLNISLNEYMEAIARYYLEHEKDKEAD